MKKLFYALIVLGFVSCEKDEIPRAKPAAGSADVVTVSMGSDYANQLFYNLENKKVVLKNNREIWDLGFESSADGFRLVLNPSKLMFAYKTNVTELSAVTSAEGVDWNCDRTSGNLDSTIIGDWRNTENVYLIDRGISITGTQLGKMKMKILSVSDTKYEIEWADLASTTSTFSTITKNSAGTFTYFSFSGGGQAITVEPPKETWDLCFTTYTHVFDGHTPYLVTGVLSNRYATKALMSNNKNFNEITYVDFLSMNFNNNINNIGYNWKVYNFDTSIYAVDNTQVFIVETSEGRVYKLRFLDFYDEFGVKGAPTMEIQEMVP